MSFVSELSKLGFREQLTTLIVNQCPLLAESRHSLNENMWR